MTRTDSERTPGPDGGPSPALDSHRQAYVSPRLERLGSWSALTLQQSVGLSSIGAFVSPDDRWWNYVEH
jgi:hypothetical protein